jgi:hypothetical protein
MRETEWPLKLFAVVVVTAMPARDLGRIVSEYAATPVLPVVMLLAAGGNRCQSTYAATARCAFDAALTHVGQEA